MPSVDTSRYERMAIDDNYNKVRHPGKTDLERAIIFAYEHREVHLQWIDHYRKHPPRTRELGRGRGGVREQEIAVRRYNVIIRALEAAVA